MNKIDNTWQKDWELKENPKKEKEISLKLIEVFKAFLIDYKIDEKSKKTKERYYWHLHALGGYIIEQAIYDEEYQDNETMEILLEQLSPYEGPLIYHSNESHQKELDTVCKRLYKFLKKNNH